MMITNVHGAKVGMEIAGLVFSASAKGGRKNPCMHTIFFACRRVEKEIGSGWVWIGLVCIRCCGFRKLTFISFVSKTVCGKCHVIETLLLLDKVAYGGQNEYAGAAR